MGSNPNRNILWTSNRDRIGATAHTVPGDGERLRKCGALGRRWIVRPRRLVIIGDQVRRPVHRWSIVRNEHLQDTRSVDRKCVAWAELGHLRWKVRRGENRGRGFEDSPAPFHLVEVGVARIRPAELFDSAGW